MNADRNRTDTRTDVDIVVSTNAEAKWIERSLEVLNGQDPDRVRMLRRSTNLSVENEDGRILFECIEASPHVSCDEQGARFLLRTMIRVLERARSVDDRESVRIQNSLIPDIGLVIAGSMPREIEDATELMIGCPTPWSGPSVSTDVRQGVGMWNIPDPALSEAMPDMPALMHLSASKEGVTLTGWSRRVIVLDRIPDVMNVLRMTREINERLVALRDDIAGPLKDERGSKGPSHETEHHRRTTTIATDRSPPEPEEEGRKVEIGLAREQDG